MVLVLQMVPFLSLRAILCRENWIELEEEADEDPRGSSWMQVN